MAKAEHKTFGSPDESKQMPKARVDLVNIGDGQIGRLVLEPGWRWSEHIKPAAGTEWCEAPHFQYHASGRLAVQMADGTQFETGPGDVTWLPSGHDAWVVGDEPVVLIDWNGATKWAKG